MDDMRLAFYGSAVIIGTVILIFMDPDGGPFSIVGGVVTGAALVLIDIVLVNRRWLQLFWQSIIYRKVRVRLSLSYLYRIKVGESYLLVKGKRFNSYIPVGGVYKYAVSAKSRLDELGVLADDLVPVDKSSTNDLRVHLQGRNLVAFFRWFESGDSRETSPWREFWEELVEDGVVSGHTFPWIFERRIRRHVTPIHFSNHAQCKEIIVADIYELEATPEQAKELEQLRQDGHPSILWADAEQIRRRGALPGKKQDNVIGEPAEWVL